MKPTPEQMKQWEADMKAHTEYCYKIKPVRDNFEDDESYSRAKAEWERKFFCDAPNKPGYHIANND